MASSDISLALKKYLDPGTTYREKVLGGVDPDTIIKSVRKGTAGDRPITEVGEGYVDTLKNFLIRRALEKLNKPIV